MLGTAGIDAYGHNHVAIAELNPIDIDHQDVNIIEPPFTQPLQLPLTGGGEFTADLGFADAHGFSHGRKMGP